MATKKPVKAAKPVAKSVKSTAKPVAKVVKSAKTTAKLVVKVAKYVKPTAKPVAKVVKSVKPTAKPTKKQVKKTVAAKSAPVKKVVAGKGKVVAPPKKVVSKKVVSKNSKNVKAIVVVKKTVAVAKANKPISNKATLKKVVAKQYPINLKKPVKKVPIVEKKVAKVTVALKKPVVAIKPVKATKVVAKVEKPYVTPILVSKPSVDKSPASKPATKRAAEKPMKPVVIPKTSTDKKVDYEPDFLKSVLDAPEPVSQGPTMRYSDQELNEFRDLINKKLDSAKKELTYLQGLITRRDEMGGDETDNRYMTMEDGGMSMEREQLSQMASRQITFIDHLEKAIMRIENKTYGICRVSGKLIDKARLRAVPHATLSMEAKLGIVSK